MKKLFAAAFAIAVIGMFLIKGGIVAEGQVLPQGSEGTGYLYSTYQVCSGDTLWDIAKLYYDKTDDDIRTYINNIMKLNHISDARTLQTGCCLSVYYLEED